MKKIGIFQSGINQCNIKVEFSIAIHRFDHQLNQAFNKELMSNVIAVSEKSEESYDVILIKRMYVLAHLCTLRIFYLIGALRTYFKTRKSLAAKKSSGQYSASAATARKRQRRHNVSM